MLIPAGEECTECTFAGGGSRVNEFLAVFADTTDSPGFIESAL